MKDEVLQALKNALALRQPKESPDETITRATEFRKFASQCKDPKAVQEALRLSSAAAAPGGEEVKETVERARVFYKFLCAE